MGPRERRCRGVRGGEAPRIWSAPDRTRAQDRDAVNLGEHLLQVDQRKIRQRRGDIVGDDGEGVARDRQQHGTGLRRRHGNRDRALALRDCPVKLHADRVRVAEQRPEAGHVEHDAPRGVPLNPRREIPRDLERADRVTGGTETGEESGHGVSRQSLVVSRWSQSSVESAVG